jgi:hypothetical protein
MEENERIEEVQVSALRASLRRRLLGGKPLILRKNSSVVGVLFCVESTFYGTIDHPRKLAGRLRAELVAVLKQLSGR